MRTRQAIIKNKNGIHCRPSAVIIAATKDYPGVIRVKNNEDEIELDTIISMLSLGLVVGTKVDILVEGPEELDVAERMVRLLEYPFDFPPKSDDAEFDPQMLAKKLAVWPSPSEKTAMVASSGQ
ncbi:MAG: HPr family phosphocarrier protein [Spirochaetales bacterium]|nr:HPr family phosphocarrier protein [Spirochaetales bacterium]